MIFLFLLTWFKKWFICLKNWLVIVVSPFLFVYLILRSCISQSTCTWVYRRETPSCLHVWAWLPLKLLYRIIATQKQIDSQEDISLVLEKWNRRGSGGVTLEGRKRPRDRGGAEPHLSESYPWPHNTSKYIRQHFKHILTHPASLRPNFQAFSWFKSLNWPYLHEKLI